MPAPASSTPVDENPWFSLRLDFDTKRELRRCADEIGVSMGELVRECLDVYLQAARTARESTD